MVYWPWEFGSGEVRPAPLEAVRKWYKPFFTTNVFNDLSCAKQCQNQLNDTFLRSRFGRGSFPGNLICVPPVEAGSRISRNILSHCIHQEENFARSWRSLRLCEKSVRCSLRSWSVEAGNRISRKVISFSASLFSQLQAGEERRSLRLCEKSVRFNLHSLSVEAGNRISRSILGHRR